MVVDKVAIVTGSNKGIGLAIVRELCRREVKYVYLTARDIARGKEAIDTLKEEGLRPQFHQLDVTDPDSVKKFADYLKDKHGGLDILINNAAVVPASYFETTYDDSKRVINTNYNSILTIQKYFFPILKCNARVINIASDVGHIHQLKNTHWIQRLTKDDITIDDINAFVDWFLNSVKDGTLKAEDFSDTLALAYRISKIAMCSLTRLQQKQIERDISINSIHPGFVQTDMTSNYGVLTAEESGIAPVYLALDVDQSVKGKYFWYDKSEKNWADPNLNMAMLHGETGFKNLMQEAKKMFSKDK